MNQTYRALAKEIERDDQILDVVDAIEERTGEDYEEAIDDIDEMLERGMDLEDIVDAILKL